MSHPNARLTVHGRRLLIERVRHGRPIAHVATKWARSPRAIQTFYRTWLLTQANPTSG
ncbi:leucine zipper domain-containing protein (plasmid) [Embleya sp. NBC_00888]|nr:leucine zipper domain-containing protein [Embleya sp. NBC_00888]